MDMFYILNATDLPQLRGQVVKSVSFCSLEVLWLQRKFVAQ